MAKKKKKAGRPITTGKGVMIGVRCHKEFLANVDRWRGRLTDKISRPEAIRRLAEMSLANWGL